MVGKILCKHMTHVGVGCQMSVNTIYLNPNLDTIMLHCKGLSGDNIKLHII